MQTFIALLRGINVGGRNLVKMADLRSRLTASGLEAVRSYIQSGNLVFEHPGASAQSLAREIADVIETHFGFRPAVHVLTVSELRDAVARNPFTVELAAPEQIDPKSQHLFFLDEQPSTSAFQRAQALLASRETCALGDRLFYLYAPEGIGRSKAAAGAERALGVNATARNLRTVLKLLDMTSLI